MGALGWQWWILVLLCPKSSFGHSELWYIWSSVWCLLALVLQCHIGSVLQWHHSVLTWKTLTAFTVGRREFNALFSSWPPFSKLIMCQLWQCFSFFCMCVHAHVSVCMHGFDVDPCPIGIAGEPSKLEDESESQTLLSWLEFKHTGSNDACFTADILIWLFKKEVQHQSTSVIFCSAWHWGGKWEQCHDLSLSTLPKRDRNVSNI